MLEVKEYFIKHQDEKYAILNQKLNIATKTKSYGVRIPVIRSYAKTLMKKYSFIKLINNIDNEYYEEILLKGFIIGNNKKLSYDELTSYIDNHLLYVSDWSMCDSFVSSLKITKKYLNELWPYLLKKTKERKEFEIRFALVMFLNYYINDDYKERLYQIITSIKNNDYYVKMANAWLISYMFMAYFDDTVDFVKNSNLDKWTISKGITKAIESRQITLKQKDYLRTLRNNIKEIN